MRLARLAAVGLAVGVIAGFAIALLRTRPAAVVDREPIPAMPDPRPTGPPPTPTTVARGEDDPTVLDVRSPRWVTG